MASHTRLHSIRVDDDLWQAAQAVAIRHHETLSDIIRLALADYADSDPESARAADECAVLAMAARPERTPSA